MFERPSRASEYKPEAVEHVRATCLYVATILGDIMEDIVIVGGFAPSLLIDQSNATEGFLPHVGTMDLDVGLRLALLDEGKYRELSERLHGAGFIQDAAHDGPHDRQRWRVSGKLGSATVDFLAPPSPASVNGGMKRGIERNFAAVITGLDLAFRDRIQVTLEGRTIMGKKARCGVWVCGPGAFVILKALAFRGRREHKDAYDLYYVVRNYCSGVGDVADRLRPLLDSPDALRAMDILREDFSDHDGIGPIRVANFLQDGLDAEIQADVVGFIADLLRRID